MLKIIEINRFINYSQLLSIILNFHHLRLFQTLIKEHVWFDVDQYFIINCSNWGKIEECQNMNEK
jgi:hypothetical protein